MKKVLICDDQKIVCEGLKTILETAPDLKVVGIAHNGEKALEMVSNLQPDLVLMDLKMPVMNGIIATRKIRHKYPAVTVLVLTTYPDDEWVYDAVRAGANGYLLKDTPPDKLIEAIHGTISGKSYIDPEVAGKVLTGYRDQSRKETLPSTIHLTDREKDVLSLIAQGLSNADIAEQLFLSEGTVRNYTSDILHKLGVSDRTQAAVLALRYGLTD
jgi:DNA-binding NarL/FixJ family response regulator